MRLLVVNSNGQAVPINLFGDVKIKGRKICPAGRHSYEFDANGCLTDIVPYGIVPETPPAEIHQKRELASTEEHILEQPPIAQPAPKLPETRKRRGKSKKGTPKIAPP